MTKIKQTRVALGLEVWEACKLADLYETEYWRIESGKRKVGAKVQKRLSDAFSIPANELFDSNGWALEATDEPTEATKPKRETSTVEERAES